jgi:hypothetical protein
MVGAEEGEPDEDFDAPESSNDIAISSKREVAASSL